MVFFLYEINIEGFIMGLLDFLSNIVAEQSKSFTDLDFSCPHCGNRKLICPQCGSEFFKITGDYSSQETIYCAKNGCAFHWTARRTKMTDNNDPCPRCGYQRKDQWGNKPYFTQL